MMPLQTGYMRFVTLWLVLAVFAGSLGFGVPGSAAVHDPAVQLHQAMDHASAQKAHGCPSEIANVAGTAAGHDDCAMTVCCFSEIGYRHAEHVASIMPAHYGRRDDSLPLQADPERSDKPPRHI